MATKNQNVLITGATSGIGYELAKLFAADGYNLVIVARNESDLQQKTNEFKQQYGVNVTPISKDLFYPGNAFELYDEVNATGMQIDILVNDAGQGHYGEFAETDIQKDIDIINLNIASLVILTKQFLKDMIGRGNGKILNLSSVASKTPGPWQSVYHGTKAFVQSFTEAVRAEVKDKGIVVTALLPGATDTDFFNKAGMQDAKIVKEGKLDDAAKVAKDGFDALMNDDDMVVSGAKNKMQTTMAAVTPDSILASKVYKQQQPASNGEK